MLVHAWIFIGVLATIATIGAVATTDDGIAIVAGTAGFILWGMWSYGALSVTVVDGGTTTTISMPPLTLLGVMFAVLPGYIALTGPIEIIRRAGTASADDI